MASRNALPQRSARHRDREPGLRYNTAAGGGGAKGCTMAPNSGRGDGTSVPVRAYARGDIGLSIVVPLFNEAAGLAALHGRIVEVARRLKAERSLTTEVVYVDDGSSDTTLAIAHGLPAAALDVQVISLSRNFGKEAALLAGLDHTRLGAVLFMDGDGQHPPSLVERLVGYWLDQGYDVVYTAKAHRENEPWLRRLGVKAVLLADQLGRAAENPRGRRRLPAAVAARGDRAQAAARAQPVLQGAGELDRLSPDPGRLRAGGAHPRPHHLEPVLAGRALDRGHHVVLGGAAAAGEPARACCSPALRSSSACRS